MYRRKYLSSIISNLFVICYVVGPQKGNNIPDRAFGICMVVECVKIIFIIYEEADHQQLM